MLRPGRTLELGVEVGPGNYTIRIDADTAVTAAIGEPSGVPSKTHLIDGYARKRAKRILVIHNAGTKSKARGTYEVSGG